MGAVNTVVCRNGRLIGHNTDGAGWVEAFQLRLPGADLSRVALLGAGRHSVGGIAGREIYDQTQDNRYVRPATVRVCDPEPVGRYGDQRYGDYRTLRGGGWEDEPWSVRASVRRGSSPDAVLEDIGLRVARGPVGTGGKAQGWSHEADRERAAIRGPLPVGWTPLREIAR